MGGTADIQCIVFHALFFSLLLQAASISSPAEQSMLADVNATRIQAGLAPLQLDARLSAAARRQGVDMAANGYFNHTSPDGRSPFDRMRSEGSSFSWAGENIAMSPDEPTAFHALVKSPGHLANILQRHFAKIGIAAVMAPDGEIFFVQDFTN